MGGGGVVGGAVGDVVEGDVCVVVWGDVGDVVGGVVGGVSVVCCFPHQTPPLSTHQHPLSQHTNTTSLNTPNTPSLNTPSGLGVSYIVNAPSLYTFAWNLLSPFLDSVTKSKIKFVNVDDATVCEAVLL